MLKYRYNFGVYCSRLSKSAVCSILLGLKSGKQHADDVFALVTTNTVGFKEKCVVSCMQ